MIHGGKEKQNSVADKERMKECARKREEQVRSVEEEINIWWWRSGLMRNEDQVDQCKV